MTDRAKPLSNDERAGHSFRWGDGPLAKVADGSDTNVHPSWVQEMARDLIESRERVGRLLDERDALAARVTALEEVLRSMEPAIAHAVAHTWTPEEIAEFRKKYLGGVVAPREPGHAEESR